VIVGGTSYYIEALLWRVLIDTEPMASNDAQSLEHTRMADWYGKGVQGHAFQQIQLQIYLITISNSARTSCTPSSNASTPRRHSARIRMIGSVSCRRCRCGLADAVAQTRTDFLYNTSSQIAIDRCPKRRCTALRTYMHVVVDS
jgi:hypothetical protein